MIAFELAAACAEGTTLVTPNNRLARTLVARHDAAMARSGHRTWNAARALPWVAQARAVCRDADPGAAGPALGRIDATLEAAERLIAGGGRPAQMAVGLLHSTMVFAATEQVGRDGDED